MKQKSASSDWARWAAAWRGRCAVPASQVHAVDARPGVADSFAAEGGIACASPAELAQHCDVIVSVVINAAQTESVLFGDGGCAEAMKPGSVFVMCSTVDPAWSAALESRLAQLRHPLPRRADLRWRGQGGRGPDHHDDLGPARGLRKMR